MRSVEAFLSYLFADNLLTREAACKYDYFLSIPHDKHSSGFQLTQASTFGLELTAPTEQQHCGLSQSELCSWMLRRALFFRFLFETTVKINSYTHRHRHTHTHTHRHTHTHIYIYVCFNGA